MEQKQDGVAITETKLISEGNLILNPLPVTRISKETPSKGLGSYSSLGQSPDRPQGDTGPKREFSPMSIFGITLPDKE